MRARFDAAPAAKIGAKPGSAPGACFTFVANALRNFSISAD